MNADVVEKTLRTAAEMERFAARFAQSLQPGSVLLLNGELGSGKTTFVRGLAKGLEVPEEVIVHSPSFTLVNEYPGKIPLFHVDLYRLDHRGEIEELDLDGYAARGGVLAVEWADRVLRPWPPEAVRIDFKILPSLERRILISFGPR